tara:strand:+ start:836 stop:1576 length:741 start_codon:yes stop_codon:yes gene_type:complete
VTNELEIIKDFQIAKMMNNGSSITQVIRENTGGEISMQDLTMVTIPAGGATAFEIENNLGESELAREIRGVIVHWNERRAYWKTRMEDHMEGDDKSPDCSSADGKTGSGDPGGSCLKCPMAQFGSAINGKAQACNAQRMLYILRPNSIMPIMLRAAPTSIAPSKKYLFGLAADLIPYWAVETVITLERVGNNPAYSKLKFAIGSRLNDADREQIASYRSELEPALRKTMVNPAIDTAVSTDELLEI